MKIKLKKYQSGGLITSIYQPVTVTEAISPITQMAINVLNGGTTTASQKSSSSKDGLTEKGLFDLYSSLKDVGLQNDAQYIIKQLQTDIFNDSLLDPLGETTDLSSRYLKAINYINQAKQNELRFKDAYELSKSKDALSEYAISSTGDVVVKNLKTKTIELVSPEKYQNNKSNYQLMTNGNLLAERQSNPKQAFNNGLLEIVQNGTSIKETLATIKQFTDGLGKNDDTLTGFSKVEQGQIQNGFSLISAAISKYGKKAVLDMMSTDSLYKIGIKDENQVKQANMAVSAIYNFLPENQKTLLKLKTDGTDKGLLSAIIDLVSKGLNNTFNFSAEVHKDPNSSSSESGEGGESKIKIGQEERYYLGLGQKQDIQFLNGTSYGFTAKNAVQMPLTDKNGKTDAGAKKASAIGDSSVNNQLILNQASMGGQVMPTELLNLIQIDGNLVAADLPIDIEAAQSQNILKPDMKTLKSLEEAEKEIKRQGIRIDIIDTVRELRAKGLEPNIQQKTMLQQVVNAANKIYQDMGLNAKYTSDGKLTGQYHRFTMINASAPEGIFQDPKAAEEAGLQEITNQARIDGILDVLNKDRGAKNQYDFDKKGFFSVDGIPFLDYDKMYDGVLFIPMKNNFLDAYTDTLSPSSANSIEANERVRVQLQGSFNG